MAVLDEWVGRRVACPHCQSLCAIPEPPIQAAPEIDPVEVVEDKGGVFRILPEDARLPDRLPGQAEVSGALGVLSVGRQTRPARCLALHPDNRLGLAGCGETIVVLDLSTGKRVFRFTRQQAPVSCLAITPDGRRVLSGDRAGGLLLWDLPSGRIVRWLRGHKDAVQSVAFSPEGRYAASGGDDGVTRLWELATGTEYELVQACWDGPVCCVAFSPDGQQLLGAGNRVCTWSTQSGEPLVHFRGRGTVESAAFSRDGLQIAACAPSTSTKTGLKVRRWQAATGQPLPCFENPAPNRVRVSLAVVVPGNLRIVSIGHKPGIRASSVTGQILDALGQFQRVLGDETSPRSPPRSYSMSDMSSTASKFDVSDPYWMQIWSVNSGLAQSHDAGTSPPTALAASHDGARVLSASRDHTVQLWGVPS
jgi:WD40 repeat protein